MIAGRLALALPLLLAAGPVLAQWPDQRPRREQRSYQNERPSPCERYIATGEKLPRQDYSRTRMLLLAIPNPSYRDKPVATAWPDEPVTILQECGLKLRIRTQRGEEGWVPTSMLNNENRLYESARRRPPATVAECAQRLLDPKMVQDCERGLAAKEAADTEARTASYLGAAELPGYLAGKTIVLRPRANDTNDDPAYPTTTYFAPDGEVFMRAGPPSGGTRWRGRWVVEGDTVCLPGGYTACARLRKLDNGRMVWAPKGYALGYLVERSDGDSASVVKVVSEAYPTPKLPPAPKGAEGFSLPSLGSR